MPPAACRRGDEHRAILNALPLPCSHQSSIRVCGRRRTEEEAEVGRERHLHPIPLHHLHLLPVRDLCVRVLCCGAHLPASPVLCSPRAHARGRKWGRRQAGAPALTAVPRRRGRPRRPRGARPRAPGTGCPSLPPPGPAPVLRAGEASGSVGCAGAGAERAAAAAASTTRLPTSGRPPRACAAAGRTRRPGPGPSSNATISTAMTATRTGSRA